MSIRKDKDFMKLLRDYHRLSSNRIPGATCLLDIMSQEDELINYIDNYLDDVVLKREAEHVHQEVKDMLERLKNGVFFIDS